MKSFCGSTLLQLILSEQLLGVEYHTVPHHCVFLPTETQRGLVMIYPLCSVASQQEESQFHSFQEKRTHADKRLMGNNSIHLPLTPICLVVFKG